MHTGLVISIGAQQGDLWIERERWNAAVATNYDAIYKVWRATPTGPNDEIKVIGKLTEAEVEELGLKDGEVKRG